MTQDAQPKVLVVEDDPLTLDMMAALCEALGLRADLVNSAADCIGALDTRPDGYDVVLMDIHMPRTSGAEAAKHIRGYSDHPPRDIPIIAVTADPKWSDERLLSEYGMNAYLPKPIDAGALSEVCRRFSA